MIMNEFSLYVFRQNEITLTVLDMLAKKKLSKNAEYLFYVFKLAITYGSVKYCTSKLKSFGIYSKSISNSTAYP
jgi:hypothetical protein